MLQVITIHSYGSLLKLLQNIPMCAKKEIRSILLLVAMKPMLRSKHK